MILSEKWFSSLKKAENMPNIVYHYCSMNSFLAILESSSLRLSNVTKSNDPTEITNVIPVLKDVITIILRENNWKLPEPDRFEDETISALVDRFFEELSKNFYAICFSERKDLLSQWVRYADNANGVALGFNTRHFVRLQLETNLQYIFHKVIYDQEVLAESIRGTLQDEISRKWSANDSLYNVNLIENAITNMVITILQFSVLFKDDFFSEENEWRLVYNPLGRIRRLGYASAYHDRLFETDQYRHEESGFTRSAYQFAVKGNSISSYVDLSFEIIRDALLQEIVIGPKSMLKPNDKDLQLLLATHGYRISNLPTEGRLVLSKLNRPFQ